MMRDLYTDPEAHDGVSDNDFDIVEHFSDDEETSVRTLVEAPKVTSGKSSLPSFPKALHRSKMSHGLGRGDRTKLSEASVIDHSKERTGSERSKVSVDTPLNGDLHASNVEGLVDIAKMTEEEINEQQQFLYERLGKETCEFLIQRRLKRLEQQSQTHDETKIQGSMLPTSDPGFCEKKSQNNETSTETHNTSKHVTFSADVHELRKMEWTNPPESGSGNKFDASPPGELWLHQLRFDFDGKLIDQLEKDVEIKHKHEGSLYNHGNEPDMPGYTIPELLELMQSSFKPQVQIATRTMCNIVYMAHLGSRRYFGYSCERWFNYVLHDIDLVGKMGYLVMENATTIQVLIDALRCMGILLFGDIIPYNYGANNCLSAASGGGLEMVMMPLQEALFDLYQQNLGLDIYSWNPLASKFTECIRRCRKSERRPMDSNEDATVDDSLEMKTRKGKVDAVYRDAIKGEFAGIDVNQIKERLADAMEIEATDEYRVQDMDSVLHLITQCDFINRLCCIMEQNKTNMVLQIYSMTVICGLLMRFGHSLAGALLEAPDFMQRLEDIMASLLVGTEQHKRSSNILFNIVSGESIGGDLELHLATAIMCCMRLVSTFHQDAFAKYLDKIGAIALVKQTLTRAYTGHLAQLFNKSTNRDPSCNLIDLNMVMPAIMAVRCLSVWAIQDVYKDTLDELVPVMDLEIFRLCDIARQGGDLLKSFLSTNGMIMAQIFTYVATLVERSDLAPHVRFSWDNERFDDLVIELCKLTETADGGNHLTMSIAAIFYMQSAYVKHAATRCGRNSPLVLTEKQRKAFRAMATYISSVAQQFSRYNTELTVDRFDVQWWNWQTLVGSVQPVASMCTRINGISQLVAPIQVANWMLEIVECIGAADTALQYELKAALESHVTLLKETLMNLLRSFNKSRLASRPVPGFEKGTTAAKPMPMLESWAVFIVSFNQLYVRECSSENLANISTVASIFGALTVSCSYATIQKLIKQLYSLCGHHENSASVEGTIEAYKEFNRMIAHKHTLGYAKLAIINFVSFIPTMVIGAITGRESSQTVEDVFLEMIVRQEGLRSEFLMWLSDFEAANNLIQAVMDPNEEISWNPKPIFIEALEILVFRRLSAMIDLESTGTIDDDAKVATVTRAWDELIEHMAKQNVTASDGGILMSASPKPTSVTEHDALGKATIGAINKFNSGLGDSPYVMAVLMLLISAFSRVDCAKKIWADLSLMVLLGRNLVLDMTTKEVTCAMPSGRLCLGPIYMYLPAFNTDEEIRRSHQKLLREFNEDDMRNGNAIMAIVMSSLTKSDLT